MNAIMNACDLDKRTFSMKLVNFHNVIILFAILLGGISVTTNNSASADLPPSWQRWEKHDPQSSVTLSYDPWNRLLARYVTLGKDGIARFDYARVSNEDRQALAGYIDQIQKTDVASLNRNEQAAYWINLYNAVTVRIILDHYPVESIRDIDISPGLFDDGPWSAKLLTIDGEDVSLDDIEHRILRPIWRDPRLHYVLNCASLGCPNLQPVAFSGKSLDMMLDYAAVEFINHPRGVRIVDGKLFVSSLYRWYSDDFGQTDDALLRHIKQYAHPDLADRLKDITIIEGHDYDWDLNQP